MFAVRNSFQFCLRLSLCCRAIFWCHSLVVHQHVLLLQDGTLMGWRAKGSGWLETTDACQPRMNRLYGHAIVKKPDKNPGSLFDFTWILVERFWTIDNNVWCFGYSRNQNNFPVGPVVGSSGKKSHPTTPTGGMGCMVLHWPFRHPANFCEEKENGEWSKGLNPHMVAFGKKMEYIIYIYRWLHFLMQDVDGFCR